MRRGLILGILGAFIITAAWWFLFMSGKSTEINDLNDQTATAQIEQSTLESRRTELQALAASEGDYLLGLSQIQNSLPTFPDGAALIEDINNIAVETGVDLLKSRDLGGGPQPGLRWGDSGLGDDPPLGFAIHRLLSPMKSAEG